AAVIMTWRPTRVAVHLPDFVFRTNVEPHFIGSSGVPLIIAHADGTTESALPSPNNDTSIHTKLRGAEMLIAYTPWPASPSRKCSLRCPQPTSLTNPQTDLRPSRPKRRRYEYHPARLHPLTYGQC